MEQLGEEIHELDRRINRVYEEEALKIKLADVEAEIKRFELGSRMAPPSVDPSEAGDLLGAAVAAQDDFRGDGERFMMGNNNNNNMGAVDHIEGMMGQGGRRLGAEANRERQPMAPQHPTVASTIANHDLNVARQFMFDQQMLAVARQMVEMQRQGNSSGGPSLDMYQAFRGNVDGDLNAAMRASAMAPPGLTTSGLSTPGLSTPEVGDGVGDPTGGQLDQSGREHFSASEQRQWQRLQRQFDGSDNSLAQSDYTLPFSPDCSQA